MRWLLTTIALLNFARLFGQNDTLRLNIVQYDSIRKFHILGITTRGSDPHRDTILRVGTHQYLPEELSPWFLEYMLGLWTGESRTFVVNYDSLHVYMIFTYLEGRHGDYIVYYKNGNVKCKGQYCPLDGDRKYGTWHYYHEDGTLKRTRKFRGGKYCREG